MVCLSSDVLLPWHERNLKLLPKVHDYAMKHQRSRSVLALVATPTENVYAMRERSSYVKWIGIGILRWMRKSSLPGYWVILSSDN